MRALYTLLVALALPFASLIVLWRGFRERSYWIGWPERFGYGSRLSDGASGLWVHAVSVGEVQAAAALVAALRSQWPDRPLTVTSATPSGRARAAAALGQGVDVRYSPYDLPWCVRGTIRRLQPALLVIMETELWPNMLGECARAGVPVLIASARLSARSAALLARCPSLLQPALGSMVSVAAQSAADAQRFKALGVAADRVQICGNIKFDRTVVETLQPNGQTLRAQYAAARPIWVAGSTHPGEEQAALTAHLTLRATLGDALLVLAPRHRPRFDEVAALVERSGLRWQRRSAVLDATRNVTPDGEAAVLLLDTLGELEIFYAAADVAFVGGSLVPVGGHNLLEPAALGIATLTGPYQHSAPDVARLLTDNGGLQVVRDAAELGAGLLALFADPTARARMASAALIVIAANRGAVARVLALAKARLSQQAPPTRR